MMYKKIQGNGSITVPAKMRHRLGIEPHTAMQLTETEAGEILLKPYQPACIFCQGKQDVGTIKGVQMCLTCYNKVRKDN